MDKIAYMILVHRDPLQLKALVDSLDYKSDFFIYVDKKSEINDFKFVLSKNKKVHFSENCKKVHWGGYSQVFPVFVMLRDALTRGERYTRYVFLTGADYPIYSAKDTYELLTKDLKQEYICGSKLSNLGNEKYRDKVRKRWYYDVPIKNQLLMRISRKILNVLLGALPKRELVVKVGGGRMDVYYGFAYWAISSGCAEYLYNIVNSYPAWKKYFKYSYAPIELLPHTIIFNSKFKKHAFEYLAFKDCDCMGYAPLHYVIYGENGTKYLNEQDYESILKSRKIFGQKFDTIYSKKLEEMLAENQGNWQA